MSELVIGGRTFRSRLFVGTGKFSSNELMARAIAASESEMVTVAMKRIDMNNPQSIAGTLTALSETVQKDAPES